jgi:ketosteroid isomerase-like protein
LAQVQEFFAALGASVEVLTFEPREYIAQGDRVAVFGRWTGRVKATGREYTSDWAMAWTIKDGRVTAFRSHEDTQAMATAFAA